MYLLQLLKLYRRLNSLHNEHNLASLQLQRPWTIIFILFCLISVNTPAHAADPNKVLRISFAAAETGFDPVATSDLYSAYVNASIFESLYTYDYIARPPQLIPQTAKALPHVSADGKTYTIHIKKGIYFQDDPVFQGKKRELTAYDYAYSLKRLLDPQLVSPNAWLLMGKLKGMDQLIATAQKNKHFDYDAPVEGIQTPDRYTLVLKLNHTDYNLPLMLAHTPSVAVAREVIEKYKDGRGVVMAHPVGTGAYRLANWIPGSRIKLTANPDYRGYIWNFKAGNDPIDLKIVAALKGKQMPQIGTVEIQIIEDTQSQWLAFKQKQLDYLDLSSGPMADIAVQEGQLIPELLNEGIYLSKIPLPEMQYAFFNMQDPTVGGITADKIALRRAIWMAFSKDNYNKVIYRGTALVNPFPVAASVTGYDEHYKSPLPYSVAAANLLLDRYHYKIRADGYRSLPNGHALTIEYVVIPRGVDQAIAEFWKRSFDKIHIRFKTKTMMFPDYLKAMKLCKVQMSIYNWVADYPDADNFFMLFNGSTKPSELGCSRIHAFDWRYLKTQQLPNGPQRQALYQQMARILDNYAYVTPLVIRSSNVLVQPWIIGYKTHPMTLPYWLYIDIKK